MSLGEYIGAGSGTTKLLLHLNGNSTDSSGNGNNGTDTNISYSQANGKFGQGAGFNGSSSKIAIASNLGIDEGSITMSIWTKINNRSVYAVLSETLSSSSRVSYSIRITSTTLNFFRTRRGISDDQFAVSDTNTSDMRNIILTYDGTTLKGYLNGSYVGQLNCSGNGSRISTSATQFGNGIGADEYFNGSIDEVIVENVAWSAEKVKKYYTMAKGRFATL